MLVPLIHNKGIVVMNLIKRSLVLASLVIVSHSSIAGTTTWQWDLKDSFNNNTQNGDSSFSADGTNSNNNSTLQADLSAFADTANPNDNIIQSGAFREYGGGLGIVNKDENGSDNQHAFDNQGSFLTNNGQNQNSSSTPDYDMALISFDTSVELTAIDFGWRDDGDFTLLAYTGNGTFNNSDLNGSTWAAQQNSGDWLTVGHYNGGEYANNSYYAVNSGATSSKYWLLGAYNSVFGASSQAGVDAQNDAFKVRKLKGNTSDSEEVPAPASFALLLMGLGGIFLRRNKKS